MPSRPASTFRRDHRACHAMCATTPQLCEAASQVAIGAESDEHEHGVREGRLSMRGLQVLQSERRLDAAHQSGYTYLLLVFRA